jgi:hypothetical protein
MTDAPKLTTSGCTRVPDVFWLEEVIGVDGFSRMVGADLPKNDAARNQGRRYILATPAALAEAPEVQALIAEAVERATRVKPLVWVQTREGWPWEYEAYCELKAGYYFASTDAQKREQVAVRSARIRAAIGGNENE